MFIIIDPTNDNEFEAAVKTLKGVKEYFYDYLKDYGPIDASIPFKGFKAPGWVPFPDTKWPAGPKEFAQGTPLVRGLEEFDEMQPIKPLSIPQDPKKVQIFFLELPIERLRGDVGTQREFERLTRGLKKFFLVRTLINDQHIWPWNEYVLEY